MRENSWRKVDHLLRGNAWGLSSVGQNRKEGRKEIRKEGGELQTLGQMQSFL